VKDKMLVYLKAAAAFVLTVGTNLLINHVDSGDPWPHTWEEWAALVGTTAVVTAGVALPRNKQTVGQVGTALTKGDFTIPDLKDLIGKLESS
jgi:hypothetical protein